MSTDQFRSLSVPDGLSPEEEQKSPQENGCVQSLKHEAPDGLSPEEKQKFLKEYGLANNLKHMASGSYLYVTVSKTLAPGISLVLQHHFRGT